MNESISTSAEFDDDRYWRFARSSSLPYGYFGTRRNFAATAMRIAIIALVIGIAAFATSVYAASGTLIDHFPAPTVSGEKVTACFYRTDKKVITLYVVGQCPARIETKEKK